SRAHGLNQAPATVGPLNRYRHLPAHGVPRSLRPKIGEGLLTSLILRQRAFQDVAKEAVKFLLVLAEVGDIAIPALSVFLLAGGMRINIRTACCGKHGKAFAESADPLSNLLNPFRLPGNPVCDGCRRAGRSVTDVMELVGHGVFELRPADLRIEVKEDRWIA